MPVIWVPLPGRGPMDGHRYRDALRPLAADELVESHHEAMHLVESAAADPGADLGDWHGCGPALSVYAQWAAYALRESGIIGPEEAATNLTRLAQLQRTSGLRQGNSAGWFVPAWWGGDIHARHQDELIQKSPENYSTLRFALRND